MAATWLAAVTAAHTRSQNPGTSMDWATTTFFGLLLFSQKSQTVWPLLISLTVSTSTRISFVCAHDHPTQLSCYP